MLHNILIVMSLTGSVVLLLYVLTYPLTKRFCSLAWDYWILKIAIVFYLFPFPYFKYQILDKTYDILKQFDLFDGNVEYIQMDMEYLVINHGSLQYISSGVRRMYIFVIGLCIVAFMVFAVHLFRYSKVRSLCLGNMESIENPEYQRKFEKLKKKLKISRKVKLVCSKYCNTPITMGVLSPIIILPKWENDMSEYIYQDIMMHELMHIKHGDLLIKFLGILVIALHWYNPFSYILYYEISNISEMYCDNEVLKNRGKEERKAYGELLLTLAEEREPDRRQFAMGILGNGRVKRRILEMKTERKSKWAASIATMLLIFMAGQATAFAYDIPEKMNSNEEEEIAMEDIEIYFQGGEFEIDDIFCDNYFTDENGNVYEVENHSERRQCSHRYQPGTTTIHAKLNSGGCTVTVYRAQRCVICNNVVRGERIETRSYDKCPH